MRILIEKAKRRLTLYNGDERLFCCRVGLGCEPVGAKEREGDGKTPEGRYFICLVKEQGKYGRSLGLSYPSAQDAENSNLIDERTRQNILLAHKERRRPPWGSPMGGEIYIHEGGSERDWTQGCIALDSSDMDKLFPMHPHITEVQIQK